MQFRVNTSPEVYGTAARLHSERPRHPFRRRAAPRPPSAPAPPSCAKPSTNVNNQRASPPQSPGVGTCREFRILGMCPAPVAGLADITELYTASFGLPPVRWRIFLRASTMVSGFESLPGEFRALVPAS